MKKLNKPIYFESGFENFKIDTNESDNIEDQLQKIWDERRDYYRESAHHIIATDELQPEEVIEEIMKILGVQVANH